MQAISTPLTENTPRVTFDSAASALFLEGPSFPTQPTLFYEPILDWIDQYLNQSTRLTVAFRLSMFDLESARHISQLLERLDSHYEEGAEVRVLWYYPRDAEVLHENGEHLSEDLDLPFEMRPYEP